MIERIAACLAGWRTGLIADRRGVAAVEFALIVPLLLSMYFVTMEVAQGIEAKKKVARVGSMVADLVAQQADITQSEIDAIMAIGAATLQPYHRSKPTVTITAIQVTDESTPKTEVVWSRKMTDGAFAAGEAAGTTTTLPEKLNTKGAFLIRVESALDYKPVIAWAAGDKAALGLSAAFSSLAMDDIYYLRPRMSTTVTCTDC